MTQLVKPALVSCLALACAGLAHAQQLSVETSKSVPVRLSGQASSVILGNKNIADVAVHSDNLLFVTGKSYGTTNLIVVNRDGQEIYNTEVVVTSNSTSLVVVTRAGQPFSYDCAPVCRGAVNLGDSPAHFDALVQQQFQMQSLSEGN